MPYKFTDQQLDKIRLLAGSAAEAYKNDSATKGAYAEVYQYIADVLAGKIDQVPGSAAPVTLGADVQQVQLWFAGAARANAGQGPFSVLIREYTQAQAELRGMGRFTDAQMQAASNAVGFAALGDVLSSDNHGALISISEIAEKDATAVGKVLFPRIPNAENNPAWSGVVLFGMLGSDQTWRVYGKDGRYTDVSQCMDTGYAHQALTKALGFTVFSKDGVLNANVGLQDLDILQRMWTLQHGEPESTSGLSPGAVMQVTLREMAGPFLEPMANAQQVLNTLAARYGVCSASSLPATTHAVPMVMWIPTVDSKGEIIGYSAESPSSIEWMDGGGYKAYFESDKASVSVAGNGAQSWMLGNSVRLEKHTDGNHEVFFLNGENDRIAVVSGNGPKRTLSQDGEKAVASEGGAQTAEGRSSSSSSVPTPSSEDSGEKMASRSDKDGQDKTSASRRVNTDGGLDELPSSEELENGGWAPIPERTDDKAVVLPSGMDVAGDQYTGIYQSIQGQLDHTTLALADNQKETLSQQLAQLGLADADLHKIPDGSITIANSEGSSDPEPFQRVMTAFVNAKGDEKELEKLFVMGKEEGGRTLLKLKQQDGQGEVVEADVAKLLPKSAALKVMEVASPQYEDRVKKIEKSLSHPGEEFSFSDRQRMAVFSRVYNGTPKDDFWPNLQSKDIGRIAEFFSDRRGGMGNTGHYSRTIDEIAMFTGRPLVKRNDATGILGKDADGNDMFVGFRRLEKVRAGQDAAELVAFSIRENSDGTKTQHNVELRLPPGMNRATDFIDSQTVEYNAVLDSQRRKSQRDSVKMSDDAERGSADNDVSANPRAPDDHNVSHRHSPSKAKLKH